MHQQSGQVMKKNPYSIGRREQKVLWVFGSSGRCPCLLHFKNKISTLCFLPLQQTNKADVILSFLKAWSERVRISRTRLKKYTPLIISLTMALRRISRRCFHCIFTAKTNFNTQLCSSPRGCRRRIQCTLPGFPEILWEFQQALSFGLQPLQHFVSTIHCH